MQAIHRDYVHCSRLVFRCCWLAEEDFTQCARSGEVNDRRSAERGRLSTIHHATVIVSSMGSGWKA